jgi:hypothetical protein
MSPLRLSSLLVLVLTATPTTHAQSTAEAPIHWAYGAYFGTGVYRVSGGEQAYILSVRPRWQLRDAALDEQGRRTVGIELRFPVAIGAYDFDVADIGATLSLDNVSTISAVPGIEFDVPMSSRWSLKPLAYVGWGAQLDGDASAWIYWTGIKSRLVFPRQEATWALVNALTYVGYSADSGDNGNVLPLYTGFEIDRPLGMKKLGDEQVVLHWHAGYTSYLNEVELLSGSTNIEHIRLEDEWELGVAFSTGQEPLHLWRLKWDRVGLAYRFSSDGDFSGISLVFKSFFER